MSGGGRRFMATPTSESEDLRFDIKVGVVLLAIELFESQFINNFESELLVNSYRLKTSSL